MRSMKNLLAPLMSRNSFWLAVSTVALSLADNASRGWKYQLVAAGFVIYKLVEGRLQPPSAPAKPLPSQNGGR